MSWVLCASAWAGQANAIPARRARRGPDLGTRSGRRLRLWAHLATLAPVIATALRVPQVLPTRPVWLALFGAPLAVSLERRGHRLFAALRFASHVTAAFSLALNMHVVGAVRLVYKQPPVEALLLLALPAQIGTACGGSEGRGRLRALSLGPAAARLGVYLAAFLAAHATATAVVFRDINFRAASGGRDSRT